MQEILRLTKELIRFRSIRDNPGEILRCADYIAAYLESNGIPYQRLKHNGVPSILVVPKSKRVKILLMSHFDVVDGPNKLFEPLIRDDRLYGRGSIDDKYAVAVSLVLMKNHFRRRKAAPETVEAEAAFGLLLTGDEESGGGQGAKKILPQIQAQFVIVLDGGSPDAIVVKEKGLLTLKLIAKGTAAHGARPWLGDNAIENLIDDYRAIQAMFAHTQPDHWHRTCNLGIIQGGGTHNQVPDHAEATLDIRYTEADDVDLLIAEMCAAIQGELIVLRQEPLFMSGSSPYIELLLSQIPGIQTANEHGASDARFLSDNAIPGIVWGAEGELSQHSENEHVIIESIATLAERLDLFLRAVSPHGAPADQL